MGVKHFLIVVIISLICLTNVIALAPPILPDKFSGTVKINNENAPMGASINVTVNDALEQTYILSQGGYYLIYVKIGSINDIIKFYINDSLAGQGKRTGGESFILNLELNEESDNEPVNNTQPNDTGPSGSSSSSSGGGGGGGGITESVTAEINFNQVNEVSVVKKGGESTTFTLDNNEVHTLKVNLVKDNSAIIVISSTPKTIELNIGETKEVDVDDDNINDISITLNKIFDKQADITIKKLVQQIQETERSENKMESPENKSSDKRSGGLITGAFLGGGMGSLKGILIAILVIAVGLFIYIKLARKWKK